MIESPVKCVLRKVLVIDSVIQEHVPPYHHIVNVYKKLLIFY